ncbi:RNA dependent RNA polymerase-domain-containing protein [Cerioporus squamosus]|nr:RNA dependent RNA polymerase-domain-containing protein [Cerioporus squamosus]
MVAEDAGAIPSRSGSSLSLSSQSTNYTQYFGEDDLTNVIADFDQEDDVGDVTTDGDTTLNVDSTYETADALTQAMEEITAELKRKRAARDEGESKRPSKILHTSQTSDSSSTSHLTAHVSTPSVVDEPGPSSVRRTDTGSTAVASAPTTQPGAGTTRTLSYHPSPLPSAGAINPLPFGASSASASSSKSTTTPSTSLESSTPADEPPPPATLLPQPSRVPAREYKPAKPVVVAHSAPLMNWLKRLPWGVQWEISRYVNTGFGYERFTIPTLNEWIHKGKNTFAAPEVTRFVEKARETDRERRAAEAAATVSNGKAGKGKGTQKMLKDDNDEIPAEFEMAFAREQSAKLPWTELDQEDQILHNHPYGALGCNEGEAFLSEDPSWYGGKVHFTAKVIVDKEKKDDFRLVLDRPTLGTSNRFMRRFGSRRFIRVRIQKDALMQKGGTLAEYFYRPFVISGAVFRAFFAKEQNVFLFRTNEVMSLFELIEWHNDLELNNDQTMAKWAARFALGLSNSVPGLRLEPPHIEFEDDIICEAFDGRGKPPSEMQMTDGCGFANRAVMQALYDKFPWPIQPTAIQCRVGGAKGLLLVRHDLPPELEDKPRIWLRPSQTKIKYTNAPLSECILPTGTDPAKLTLDVLRASRLRCPAKLSTETITNFAENGVPFERFGELFQVNIKERLDALLDWDKSPSEAGKPVDQEKYNAEMKLLWHALSKEGGVMPARLARASSGTARVAGHVADDREEEEWDDEDGLTQLDRAVEDRSSAWWEDPISGQPSSLEETCMVMLDSGFRPETNLLLRAKLKEVARKVVKTFRTRYRFTVPMSCSAFIVPDPYGVLGPGEIHVKSSQRNLPDSSGRMTDLVKGDVLVTRHPCKVPSDVQKVRAVEHYKLSHYVDVIVVSTKSHVFNGESLDRHLASLTGGGDYDGDTMEVFWDPRIVQDFKSPDPRKFAVEPPTVKACLLKNSETVREYQARMPADATDDFKIYSLQTYLLGALQDKSLVGQYSTWWENSTYHKGYDHPETIFLAYMFCAILDGSKTGVTVKPEIYREHCRNNIWQSRGPAWKEAVEEEERHMADYKNRSNLRRQPTLDKFVMDHLHKVIQSECNKESRRIEAKLVVDTVAPYDSDLAAPWENACERARTLSKVHDSPRLQEELDMIKAHVEAMYDKEKAMRSANANKGQKHKTFTDLPIEKRQDVLRAASLEFHRKPANLLCFSAHEARRVKASYAYIYDTQKTFNKWSRFPWNVSMRDLCEIKAEALGCPKTVAFDFYHWMNISQAYLRKHTQDFLM